MSDKIFLKDITLPIIETGENETYSFVQTDSDLETAGDAADAKKVGDELTQLKADLSDIDELLTLSETETKSKNVTTVSGQRIKDGLSGQKVWLPIDFEPGDTIAVSVDCSVSNIVPSYTIYFGTSEFSDTTFLNNCHVNTVYIVKVPTPSNPDKPYVYIDFYTGTALEGGATVTFKAVKTTYNKDSLTYRTAILDAVAQNPLRDTAYTENIYSDQNGWANEGACTDGTYIYWMRANNFETYELCKYNLSTGEFTAVSYTGEVSLGHGNDMTYDPETGYIYIVPMEAGKILVFDTNWNYIETITTALSLSWNQIAYSRTTGTFFVSANVNRIYEYDKEFTTAKQIILDTYPTLSTYLVSQGMEIDGRYIYCLYNIKSSSTTTTSNIIYVYDLNGYFIKTIAVAVAAEAESICNTWQNDMMYLFCNNSSKRLFTLWLNKGMTVEQYEFLVELGNGNT